MVGTIIVTAIVVINICEQVVWEAFQWKLALEWFVTSKVFNKGKFRPIQAKKAFFAIVNRHALFQAQKNNLQRLRLVFKQKS